jgi:hypothetical protein
MGVLTGNGYRYRSQQSFPLLTGTQALLVDSANGRNWSQADISNLLSISGFHNRVQARHQKSPRNTRAL